MAADFIKFAFVAGELSPHYHGRSDLEKFDLGLALARNFFVDYRGGLVSRAGTKFVDYIKRDDLDTRFFEFRFNAQLANTYIMLFGHQYIRFLQDGGYVLEAAKTITSFVGAQVNATSHGYSAGDWIKIGGRTLQVGAVNANDFQLQDPFGNSFDSDDDPSVSGATQAFRIYTLVSPYSTQHLAGLTIRQINDTVKITHIDFPPKNLVRAGHTSWSIANITIGNDQAVPTSLDADPSTSGNAGFVYGVTAVDRTGAESILSDKFVVTASVDYTATAGFCAFDWLPVAGAKYYNVYRSIILSDDAYAGRGMQVGFLGQTYGAQFVDNNIIPDFTAQPPVRNNPFAPGAIESISVTAGGSGYTNASAVSITDADGTGFAGYLVVDSFGAVTGVVVTNGGEGYTGPTVVTTIGTGATFTVEVAPLTGTYPSLVARFQQRLIFAASLNQPLTVWGSRPKRYDDFDVSEIVADNDSYEFDLDSDEVNPIRHMLETRGGLILMLANGVWQLSGGSDAAVTPTNALAEPHSYTGVSPVVPLRIDTDLVYTEDKSGTVRMLSYNEFSKVYAGTDVSILSNHFFDYGKRIESWAYARDPHKVVWAVRSDGALLAFTTVREQNVFGWTQCNTQGYFRDIISVAENGTDQVYFVVERRVNGRWTKFIESQASRLIPSVEDSWCVDCALALEHEYPNAVLSPNQLSGSNVLFTASSSVFSSGDVDKIIWTSGGKAQIISYTSGTQVRVNWLAPGTLIVPETLLPQAVARGAWSMADEVTTLSGLWHLEGSTVSILADGNVVAPQVVVDGAITLPRAASKVVVGLSFRPIAKTLPLTASDTVIEGKPKIVITTDVRVMETRGLAAGYALDSLYDFKDRTDEEWGQPTRLQEGSRSLTMGTNWDEGGQIYFVQDHPLPVTILGYVFSSEVGDED